MTRALRLLSAVEKRHPTEPHWYLEAIGTVREARGQGIGPKVLTPVLQQCDEARLPAYLESSNLQNIPFYERPGFVTMPLFDLPAGCGADSPDHGVLCGFAALETARIPVINEHGAASPTS